MGSLMADNPKTGIVTVTYNSAPVIDDFMVSLLAQEHTNFVLYVVDNASSDDTLEQLSKFQDPRIVIIRNPTNVGVAEGNNIGIRAALRAGCKFVLLINNDTTFNSALLFQLHSGLLAHRGDMIVPKIVYFDDPGKIWAAGGYFSRLWGSSRHFGFGKKDIQQFDQPRLVQP